MHILLIHQAYAALDEPGGTRHHEFALLLAEMGHKVTIIASPISYLSGSVSSSKKLRTYANGNVRVYRTYTYPALHKSFIHRFFSFFTFSLSSFLQALKINKVDVVWGTSPPIFQAATSWGIAKLKRVPFLLEVRDLWPAFAVAVGVLRNRLLIRMSEWLERFLYIGADQIIVNSPGYIDHVEKRGGKNIKLVPNGSDISLIRGRGKNKALRKKMGWEDKFVVLYTGAHGISNDLGVVLRAAKLLEHEDRIRIILLGDGKEKHNLQLKVANLDLENVEFLNPVPKNEIAGYLSAADACLAILKPIDMFKTTYPNKVFDYMAAGKPIILSIDGVIREVVEQANCGIFCEPGDPKAISDAILGLYNSRGLARRYGTNGKNYLMKHFERKKSVIQFSYILENILLKK